MSLPNSVDIPPELRREMIRRARDKRLRDHKFSSEEPTVWNPTQVLNPECEIPFTHITVWHFIADQLEAGCAVTEVALRKPPGETAYEMTLKGAPGQPRIYVKVQLRNQGIYGRSFHNSTGAEK